MHHRILLISGMNIGLRQSNCLPRGAEQHDQNNLPACFAERIFSLLAASFFNLSSRMGTAKLHQISTQIPVEHLYWTVPASKMSLNPALYRRRRLLFLRLVLLMGWLIFSASITPAAIKLCRTSATPDEFSR